MCFGGKGYRGQKLWLHACYAYTLPLKHVPRPRIISFGTQERKKRPFGGSLVQSLLKFFRRRMSIFCLDNRKEK